MMNPFERQISKGEGGGLYAVRIEVIQVNIGLQCNQSCAHCHLSAGPERKEVMNPATMEKVLDIAGLVRPTIVDITGGAPEMNPHLRPFIDELVGAHHPVQVRTNFTALLEPVGDGLMEFFRDRHVALVGSLPCYLEANVRQQRGEGVYEGSIEAIRRLNDLGYGKKSHLELNLVYNPGGDWLPGRQGSLETDYRRELMDRFGLVFTRLFTITNMPIGRFSEILVGKNRYEKYMRRLKESFNPDSVRALMCRRQISIGWDGRLYDCDFNLALGLSMNHGAPDHIDSFNLDSVVRRRIVTGEHCFGCTAGCGSSCGGELAG